MKDLLTGFSNKKGSFAIFAVMAFTAMLIMLAAAISASSNVAIGSVTDCFGRLWGKSLLSEYDVYLKERYGILGFQGDEASIEKKLKMYIDYSFAEKDYVNYKDVDCQLEDYTLIKTENLKSEIEKIVKSGFKPKVEEDKNKIEDYEDRYISNNWIIQGLPSYGKTEKTYFSGVINKIKAGIGINEMIGNIAADKYILTFFKDCVDKRDLKDTYFNCEVEYIISGELSDLRAKKETRSKLKLLRNSLNLYYLYTCTEKREGALTLATAITPGPAAVLTQAVILEMWAYAEAENDMKILYDKKTVPLLKNDSNWALSIENVFGSSTEEAEAKLNQQSEEESAQTNYVSPQTIEGQEYSKYLGILLCGISEETKLLRIMDLIQINMKYLYSDSFLLSDYNIGLNYQVTVNGRRHEFEEKY